MLVLPWCKPGPLSTPVKSGSATITIMSVVVKMTITMNNMEVKVVMITTTITYHKTVHPSEVGFCNNNNDQPKLVVLVVVVVLVVLVLGHQLFKSGSPYHQCHQRWLIIATITMISQHRQWWC